MSPTEISSVSTEKSVRSVDMKLEVHVIPVSDVDRSKGFYERLGWRLDDDVAPFDVGFLDPGDGQVETAFVHAYRLGV